MRLHYTIWIKNYRDHEEPIPTDSPRWITTSEQAREDARALVLEKQLRAKMLTIEDENGTLLEEWRWRRNKWVELDREVVE